MKLPAWFTQTVFAAVLITMITIATWHSHSSTSTFTASTTPRRRKDGTVDGLVCGEKPSTKNISIDMPTEVAETEYRSIMSHQHCNCTEIVRAGTTGDGGYNVCLAGPYRPGTPCLVYSFGIRYEFSFDDSMSSMFNCTVRSFDPSMDKVGNHRRGENIWFYRTGIGKTNMEASASPMGWRMRNLQTIIEELNDTATVIDVLKIDIEGGEYDSLDAMFTTDVLQKYVKQLIWESHLRIPLGHVDTPMYHRTWKAMKHLEDIGFRRLYALPLRTDYGGYIQNGELRTCCYEMAYINTAFLEMEQNRK